MTDEIPTFDRSTLERKANCPQQGWLMDQYRTVVGEIAEAGTQVHEAISRTIDSYIYANGLIGPQDIVNTLEQNLWSSRPDVQPETMAAMRRSVWSFGKFLSDHHFKNILRFDGGLGDQSGQLTHEFAGMCRVTAELDLLLASPSKQEVDVYDWKSGWKQWRSADVKKSFQFQMQAWLVLENYPAVEMVRVTIWNLRENRQSYSVEFLRRDRMEYEVRVRSAAEIALKHTSLAMRPDGWPTTEKCALCPVAALCDVGDQIVSEIGSSPEQWVDRLVALESRSAAIEKALAKVVADRGADIETPAGNRFGFDKPKKKTKPKAALYSGSESSGDDEGVEVSADNPFAQFKKGKL